MGKSYQFAILRDYSNINFTNLAGLSKLVLINEVLSAESSEFWAELLQLCHSSLSLFMDGTNRNDFRVYNFCRVPVEDISRQNIRATCFHSNHNSLPQPNLFSLVPVLFFSFFGE